jgi:hypothetical protein
MFGYTLLSMDITLNSNTTGKYQLETDGGREYLITRMRPIVGDECMNGLLYPMPVVTNSLGQLDQLPCPAGHPTFGGQPVSALDPKGGAPFSIGAHVRRPTLNRKEVFAELAIDIEVANRSEQGKEVLNRIKSGKRLGVSTGLNGKIDQTAGTHNGQDYYGSLTEIRYDHVAVLLDEAPAGDTTYTLNRKQRVNTMRTVELNTEELSLADHHILQNAAKFPLDIIKALMAKTTVKEATGIINQAGQQVIDDPKAYEQFLANRDHLAQWLETKADKRTEKVTFIVENSEMTADHLVSLSDDALDTLLNSIKPKNVHIAAFNSGGAVELDLSALEA